MINWFRNRRRRRLLSQPYPEGWREILSRRVRHYLQLDESLRHRLEQKTRIFATERRIEAVGGLPLDDDVRLTVAGQACLLLLGVDGYYFDRVPTIILQPTSYAHRSGLRDDGIVDEDAMLAGEAWQSGPIVLSWEDVLDGGQHHGQGNNVVLHEFAHHLDGLDGEMGGMPPLTSRQARAEWTRVSRAEFARLNSDLDAGRRTLLDPYAANNLAEFFAVSTECFFETPRRMRDEQPQWYEQLRSFYRVDPAEWEWTW